MKTDYHKSSDHEQSPLGTDSRKDCVRATFINLSECELPAHPVPNSSKNGTTDRLPTTDATVEQRKDLDLDPATEQQYKIISSRIVRLQEGLHTLFEKKDYFSRESRRAGRDVGMQAYLKSRVFRVREWRAEQQINYATARLRTNSELRMAVFDRMTSECNGCEVTAEQRKQSFILRDISFPPEKHGTLYTFKELLTLTRGQKGQSVSREARSGVCTFFGARHSGYVRDRLIVHDAGLGMVSLRLLSERCIKEAGTVYTDDALKIVRDFVGQGTIPENIKSTYSTYIVKDPFLYSVFRKQATGTATDPD